MEVKEKLISDPFAVPRLWEKEFLWVIGFPGLSLWVVAIPLFLSLFSCPRNSWHFGALELQEQNSWQFQGPSETLELWQGRKVKEKKKMPPWRQDKQMQISSEKCTLIQRKDLSLCEQYTGLFFARSDFRIFRQFAISMHYCRVTSCLAFRANEQNKRQEMRQKCFFDCFTACLGRKKVIAPRLLVPALTPVVGKNIHSKS